jgi:hypothetical protein
MQAAGEAFWGRRPDYGLASRPREYPPHILQDSLRTAFGGRMVIRLGGNPVRKKAGTLATGMGVWRQVTTPLFNRAAAGFRIGNRLQAERRLVDAEGHR